MVSAPYKTTKRLIIRPLELKDYQVWKYAHSNLQKKQNQWDLTNRPSNKLTKNVFKTILKNQAQNRKKDWFYDLGVFIKKTDEYIGIVSLMNITRVLFQNAYLGYWISNNYWKQGFGKESVKGCIDIAFKQLNLHRLEAGISINNKRSIGLIKSLGFRKEGFSKKRLFLNNRWEDMILYALTSEDMGIRWKKKVEKRPNRF